MGQVILFVLAVLLANVSGWGTCTTQAWQGNANTCAFITVYGCPMDFGGSCGCSRFGGSGSSGHCVAGRCETAGFNTIYVTNCTSKSEADSVKCELNPNLPDCQQAKDTTLTICLTQKNSLGGYVSNIHRCSCKANNGEVYQCNGKSNVDINNDCPIVRTIQGTCSENGYPNGEPTDDSSGTSAECYAITGNTCHMRDRATRNTFRCECDGSCDFAQRKLASGECANPYPPPQTGNDSLDLPLPDQPPQSSGSEPPQSSGATCDNCSALQAIQANTQDIMESNRSIEGYAQTTMDNTTDIKNGLTEMAIDVSHIRTATENTDLTTQGIDSKLSNTNSLLNDIKNKNWEPQINFNPNITLVDSVRVNVDTAKSPFEILSILRQNNYNENDTVGAATTESSLRAHIDSSVNEGVPNMKDSIPKAVQGVRSALYNLRDTLNKGAYMDSVTAWEIKLTDNGVITGGGSQDCPEPLRRSFTWNLGSKLGVIQIGSFKYICDDLLGIGITLWGLARMVLRCMVSILCMLWIYRTVIGVESSNDED